MLCKVWTQCLVTITLGRAAAAHSAGHTITQGRRVETSLATWLESAPTSVLFIARTCSHFQASMYPLLLSCLRLALSLCCDDFFSFSSFCSSEHLWPRAAILRATVSWAPENKMRLFCGGDPSALFFSLRGIKRFPIRFPQMYSLKTCFFFFNC